MRKFTRPLLLLLVGLLVVLIWFLAMTRSHMTALMREHELEGFQCVMSHRWFGRMDVDEVEWRWLVPGWSLTFLETQKGYSPSSVADLAKAADWFPGAEAVSFLDLPGDFLALFLSDLELRLRSLSVEVVR